MKKLVVILAILAAAAACGGAASSATTSQSSRLSLSQSGGAAPQQPSKISGQPSGTTGGSATANPSSTSTVPVLQGPPVIRQAQLAISVGSGSFDSKLASVRSLVESEQGYMIIPIKSIEMTTRF